MLPGYKLVRTEEFIQKSFEISKKFPRVIELNQSIDRALFRKPNMLTQLLGEFYFLVTVELTNPYFPEVKVLYKIIESEYKVVLLDIEEV